MATSDSDVKILWGRAAGICSNPDCRQDLTVILEQKGSYNIGEMAHVIARKPGGPRGKAGGGADDYANLILLCPTCHTRIDKAPEGEYPEPMLHEWKQEHENSFCGKRTRVQIIQRA
jgi:5-methylcytosine-specific restriction endonuclease McrA